MQLTQISPGIYINLDLIRGIRIDQTTGNLTLVFDATQTFAIPANMRDNILIVLGLQLPPTPPGGGTVLGSPTQPGG